jgi:septal ring factor EnvC (AmiA/AmiB activator)
MFSYGLKKNLPIPFSAVNRVVKCSCFAIVCCASVPVTHAVMPVSRYNTVVTNLTAQRTALEALKKTLELKIATLTAELTKAKTDITTLNSDKTKLTTEKTQLQTQIKTLEQKVATLTADLKKSADSLKQVNDTLAKTKADLATANANLSKVKAELTTANTNLTKTKTDLTTANTNLTKTKTELTTANTNLTKMTTENKKLNADLLKYKADLEAVKRDKENIVKSIGSELDLKTSLFEQLTREYEQKQNELTAQKTTLTSEIDKLKAEMGAQEQNAAELQAKIQEAAVAQETLQKEMTEEKERLEEELKVKETELQGQITQIMQQLDAKNQEMAGLVTSQTARDAKVQSNERSNMIAIDILKTQAMAIRKRLIDTAKALQQCQTDKHNTEIKYQQEIATLQQNCDKVKQANQIVEAKHLMQIDGLKTQLMASAAKYKQLLDVLKALDEHYQDKINQLKHGIIKLKVDYTAKMDARNRAELQLMMHIDSLKTRLNDEIRANRGLLQGIQEMQVNKDNSDVANQEVIAELQAALDELLQDNQELAMAVNEWTQKNAEIEEAQEKTINSLDEAIELLEQTPNEQWIAITLDKDKDIQDQLDVVAPQTEESIEKGFSKITDISVLPSAEEIATAHEAQTAQTPQVLESSTNAPPINPLVSRYLAASPGVVVTPSVQAAQPQVQLQDGAVVGAANPVTVTGTLPAQPQVTVPSAPAVSDTNSALGRYLARISGTAATTSVQAAQPQVQLQDGAVVGAANPVTVTGALPAQPQVTVPSAPAVSDTNSALGRYLARISGTAATTSIQAAQPQVQLQDGAVVGAANPAAIPGVVTAQPQVQLQSGTVIGAVNPAAIPGTVAAQPQVQFQNGTVIGAANPAAIPGVVTAQPQVQLQNGAVVSNTNSALAQYLTRRNVGLVSAGQITQQTVAAANAPAEANVPQMAAVVPQSPLSAESQLVNEKIESIYQAVLQMTNGDSRQANAAMNAIGSGEELPKKVESLMEVFKQQTDPALYGKITAEISNRFQKKTSFTDGSLRYLYGENGNQLLDWSKT